MQPPLDLRWAFVGLFLSDRPVKTDVMKQTMASIWQPGRGVCIQDIDSESNICLFQFAHEVDLKRFIAGGPWTFENKVLVMERVKPGKDPSKIVPHLLDIWVQIHEVLVGFRSKFIARSVGSKIGEFVESNENNFSGCWKSYIRIRVRLDIRKALRKGLTLMLAKGESHWVSFKYERIPTYCFLYECIGYGEKFCNIRFELPEEEIVLK